jgi:hypothetical protein
MSDLKKLKLIILSLAFFNSNAQEVNYLKTYHPIINQAEVSIMDGKYKDALTTYEKAFTAVPKAFMKDYFNAAVCATYLGDATNTYKYLLEVAGKGISLDFIKDEPAFIGIQRDPNWREFEKQYLTKKRDFESKINKSLLDKLNKIYDRDQWFRMRNPEAFADSIIKLDKQNARELDYLIAKYGLPNEDNIGCGEGGTPIIQYPFYTVIKRQSPENQTVNFSNALLEGMRKGQVSPHTAASLMATINGNDTFFARYVYKILGIDSPSFQGKPFSSKIDKWVFRQIEKEDELRINQMRLTNGMETLAEYRRKVIFALKDNRFLFPYRAFANVWQVTDPNIASDYLEGTVVLE